MARQLSTSLTYTAEQKRKAVERRARLETCRRMYIDYRGLY